MDTQEEMFGGGLYTTNGNEWNEGGWFDDAYTGARTVSLGLIILCVMLLVLYLFVDVPKGLVLGVGLTLVATMLAVEYLDSDMIRKLKY